MNFPMRGEVYWVELDPTKGTEINKTRPAVVISNNAQNKKSSCIIIAPITSSDQKVFDFQVKIDVPNLRGKILLNQIRTIDKSRISKQITMLDEDIIEQINDALKIALDLL